MAEYQNVKIYISNIVDIVIIALATVANIFPILFNDTKCKIISGTTGGTTTSINGKLIFITCKTAVQKQWPDEWQPQPQEFSPDEQQPQQSPSVGQYPILIEISSEEDLPEIPIATRKKNSDITTLTTIIQNLSSNTSDKFEDVNFSYIVRRKNIQGLVFENFQMWFSPSRYWRFACLWSTNRVIWKTYSL